MTPTVLIWILLAVLVVVVVFIVRMLRAGPGQRRLFNAKPAILQDPVGRELLTWVTQDIPDNYYACPAIRLVDALSLATSGKGSGVANAIMASSTLGGLYADVVLINRKTSQVVALIQRPKDPQMQAIERLASDAGVPVIEGEPGKVIPWNEI